MATNLKLYEALKRHMDEETARMLVETLPRGEDLATKGDVLEVRRELSALEARLMRWMLTFFASLWLGFAGTIVTIILTG